jgi:hypothetical protein
MLTEELSRLGQHCLIRALLGALLALIAGCVHERTDSGVEPWAVKEAADRWGHVFVGTKFYSTATEGVWTEEEAVRVEWEVEPGAIRLIYVLFLGLYWEPGDEVTAWIEPTPGGGTSVRVRRVNHVQLLWVIPILWSDGDRAGRHAERLLKAGRDVQEDVR